MKPIQKIMIAFLIVLGFPLVSYFIVLHFSKKAIVMPRHFFYDTVIQYVEKGKLKEDTLWHSVKNFNLVNQLGDSVSWKNLEGKIVVVDFIFTRCASFCPRLTNNMKILQEAFKKKKEIVHLISFSVDPEYDSPEILKSYADKNNVNHYMWWMLSGSQKKIYDLAFNEFHVAAEEDGQANFVHTDKFILLDRKRCIRGYYEGQDSLAIKKLADDIVFLTLEKQKRVNISN